MSVEDSSPPQSPKVAPETVALRAQPRPVVRLNRRMLAVGAGTLAAAVLGGTMWSLQSQKRERDPAAELYNVERVARADGLDQLPKDYAGMPPASKPAPPVLGPPLPGDLGAAMAKAQQPMEARAGHGVDPAQAERLAAEEAARSSVFFRRSGDGAAPMRRTVAENAMTATAADVSGPRAGQQPFNPLGAMSPAVASPADPVAAQNRQDRKEAFLANAGDTTTRNPGGLQLPASPYQVVAGTIIPAALVTGINSDLPGQVIASVTEAVYDTASGRHLLIPQGSRLIGRYDSQVAFGQRRVLLVWMRLILPDTSSVALDRLPGIDPAGYAGLEDGVDWHWDRILAGAALSTLLGVGAELAAPQSQTDQDGNRLVIAVREGAQDTVNQVGQEITKRNASIQPTLTIRPGFPVRVMVSKDLILRPYQPLFFQRGASQ
ncbi:type IV secretion system protein VirB10 [Variovorax beijingensis]|uniref:Type IV secretion system protein VirB10 n=1 Tax=Variovorax beijingensis TaxID=2496117 RepID=A0A561BGE6_9BURK|nr:TrbI/VirB10 family protein [Variovorax beijingensis]TWD77955.1 type IV secretion system protein VirB10 [Variovorax beijingensis]